MGTRTTLLKQLNDADLLFLPEAKITPVPKGPNGGPVRRVGANAQRPHHFTHRPSANPLSVEENKIISPLQALHDTCRSKRWNPPIFLFNRERKNGIDGFVFTVQLPQFNLVIGPNMNTWNQDREVARNLAAEACLNVVRAMSQ